MIKKKPSLGADNEIRVICSKEDRDIVERYLSLVFTDSIFTPEPEPYYYLKFSDPSNYEMLKSQAYIIIAFSNKNPKNSGFQLIKQILPEHQFNEIEKDNPMILGKDVFAKDQLFMILNFEDEQKTNQLIKDKKNFIRRKYNDQFISRQRKFILDGISNTDLEKDLSSKYDWSIKIPWGWELIKERPDSNFIWIGREMPFQWISISWESGNIISNELKAGNYLWSWLPKYYDYIQSSDYKLELDKTNFNNNYAWRLKGVWETKELKISKGGPFVSYLFYDEKNDLTYHINYLVHYPGKDKSLYMRQLDLIVKSFKI
ncbi:MAG: DUF4837 family protein [Candidatus Neomarinimicrobiota bacterium]